MMHRFIFKGVVQGVGFRPTISKQAKELGLKGYIRNLGDSVELVIDDKSFVKNMDLPLLSRIDSIEREEITTEDSQFNEFSIIDSDTHTGISEIPPDLFMCKDCLREILDPNDRRYRHFFNTCTNCGPRFSISFETPYDRKTTSMKEFEMCRSCAAEYKDQENRRYHAQTIACHDCGPKIELKIDGNVVSTGTDAIVKASVIIREGKPICIKGIGGYHICSITRHIEKVRKLLNRKDKPFAIMVKDENMLKKIAYADQEELRLLKSNARPIVVLKKIDEDYVSELDSIGVMFPYSALHYILFEHIDEPLLMTSSNLSGEPVDISQGRGKIILEHNRKIINRCDDSVVKVIDKPIFLRRSRGYVPCSIRSRFPLPSILALGAQTNSTVAISNKSKIIISQHIGDISEPKSHAFMIGCSERLLKDQTPEYICIDHNPNYSYREFAETLSIDRNIPLIEVQHHKAHVTSVALEHGLNDFVGIACDGSGYGDDGTVWGGEIFDFQDNKLLRVGSLEYQPMIGGDKASRFPRHMLGGILINANINAQLKDYLSSDEIDIMQKQLKYNFNTIWTSSSGRILDAVAAMLGLLDENTYEGRGAMLLESVATIPYPIKPVIKKMDGRYILLTKPLFIEILQYKDKGRIAATAQTYLAEGMYKIARRFNKPIVFSGGVAYNRMITSKMHSLGVLTNVEIPPGDGGISFGQVAYMMYSNTLRED